MSDIIEGIKCIKHNASGIHEPDDLSYPWILQATFRPTDFMTMAFIGMYGGQEEVVVIGMTQEALEEFATRNNLRHHARVTSFSITYRGE